METTAKASDDLSVDGRSIGSQHSPYIIAELSANHSGSIEAAKELIALAKNAGADAVKLQHYTPETITARSEHPDFRVKGDTLWDGRQLADLYAEAMTPWEWTDELASAAHDVGITWFSSPFDPTAVDFLAGYDVPMFKIASFELVDLPLIRYTASFGKPMIMSTGMASVDEIEAAVVAARSSGAPGIALLRCNSAYPARTDEMDLSAITTMRSLWNVPVGLSDHTRSHTAAITAVALGACIVEKHITLDRSAGGPDAEFSLEPKEFSDLVEVVRAAHASLGRARFGPSKGEVPSLAFRRSLRAVVPVRAGEVLTEDNVRSIRPAGGLRPDSIDDVVGRVAAFDLEVGAPVTWDVLEPSQQDGSPR